MAALLGLRGQSLLVPGATHLLLSSTWWLLGQMMDDDTEEDREREGTVDHGVPQGPSWGLQFQKEQWSLTKAEWRL